jgi:hypothetical protein
MPRSKLLMSTTVGRSDTRNKKTSTIAAIDVRRAGGGVFAEMCSSV